MVRLCFLSTVSGHLFTSLSASLPPLHSCCPLPLKNQFGTEVHCPAPPTFIFIVFQSKFKTAHSNLRRPDSHLHSGWVRELFSTPRRRWGATDAVQRLTNEPTNWLLRAFPTTEAKQNKSRLTKCWMKWRNGASRLLRMIPLPRSHPLFLLISSSFTPTLHHHYLHFFRFVQQTHIDPRALDPVGGLVPLHRSTAHDWRFPYGRWRYTAEEIGRERVSEWKTQQPRVRGREEGAGAECDSWSMVLLQLHSN